MQYLKVLGTVQDGGYPHPGCFKDCCNAAWKSSKKNRLVSSIAIIDDTLKKYWLLDISPDIKEQIYMIGEDYTLEGIFLTHAHFGHYLGLFQLGLEVMNLKNISVYAMPLMNNFLIDNPSINFLIQSNNIIIKEITEAHKINLNENISVIPFLVPHRNELSETVAYKIFSDKKSFVYLPDIDSWIEWNYNILDLIKENDMLFLDGTFYDKKEISSRSIEKIPHPSIKDSMSIFDTLSKDERGKIYFTHLNHTNIIINQKSLEYIDLLKRGYNVAEEDNNFNF